VRLGTEDDTVPAMKVNLSAAMRARDVSRPRPEQLAEAEAAEASIADSPGGPRGNAAVADPPEGGAREGTGAREVTGSRVRQVASAKTRDAAGAREAAGARGAAAEDAAGAREAAGEDAAGAREAAGARDAAAEDAAGARVAAGAEDGGDAKEREGDGRRAARAGSKGKRKRRVPRDLPRRGRRADLGGQDHKPCGLW